MLWTYYTGIKFEFKYTYLTYKSCWDVDYTIFYDYPEFDGFTFYTASRLCFICFSH